MDRTLIKTFTEEKSTASVHGFDITFTKTEETDKPTRVIAYGNRGGNGLNASMSGNGSITITFTEGYDSVVASAVIEEMEIMVEPAEGVDEEE